MLNIALFDYKVTPTNPAGSCHLRLLRHLRYEHNFTVFAVEFENPDPERIRWVRIPAPTRPLALLFVVYHVVALFAYIALRLRGRRFDIIQFVESNVLFGDVSYAHFCHTRYLKRHWRYAGNTGIRGWWRWLDHRLHALAERWVYQRVRWVVVPSSGLARDLVSEFPKLNGKTYIVPNAVEIQALERPPTFERAEFRARLGLWPDDVVVTFTALGNFEHKGLPLLLYALSQLRATPFRLLVVGGVPRLIAQYRRRAAKLGVADRVQFVGMQRDVRPYLWAADAFALPSVYEAFSLVSLEAAAAGLPLLTTPSYGLRECLENGINGFVLERTPGGVLSAVSRLLALSPSERVEMGKRARDVVQVFSAERFVADWRGFYGPVPVLQSSSADHAAATDGWHELFQSPNAQGRRIDVRVLRKHGLDFLILPTNNRAAAAALELYPAQTPFARTARMMLRIGLKFGIALGARRTELMVDDRAPLLDFMRDLAKDQTLPPFAILSGNPAARGRRYVIAIFDENGQPRHVVKAGIEADARQLIRRESKFVQQIQHRIESAPLWQAELVDERLQAFATPFVSGESPQDIGPQKMAAVLSPWLDEKTSMRVEDLAVWQRLREQSKGSGGFAALHARCGGRILHPALYHGDFAPWNLKADADGRWQIVDWERGELKGPPAWDWFHFITQPPLLVTRLSTEGTAAEVKQHLSSSEFQAYATSAGISGFVEDWYIAYLRYCRDVLQQTEGWIRLNALVKWLEHARAS